MPRIAVVGSLNMDLVVRTERFAEPGETLSGSSFMTAAGGKGANQAVAARRLGAEVVMIGRVGDDAFGRELLGGLDGGGVDVQHVSITSSTSTGVALITVDSRGENTIIVVAGANGALSRDDVTRARTAITSADVVMAQLEVPLAAVTSAVRLAREAGVAVILNAAPARALDDDLLSSVDYLIVNRSEALLMASGPSAAAPEDIARMLLARGPRTVVMTLGSSGALLARQDGEDAFAAAHVVDVVDTTAAGDAFAGAFAVAIAEGRAPADALRIGTVAGALTVTRAGAQPSLPTRAEVDRLISGS